MTNIIDFFIRHKNTLLFIFLLLISLGLTFQSHSYQRSKFISSSNAVSGGVFKVRNNIESYFGLKESNHRLINENKKLREKILNFQGENNTYIFPDTTGFSANYTIFNANVISNNYSKLDNYILIDKGGKDNLEEDQGVITSQGIVGVVEKTSKNYSRVISILNTNLAVSAQLKNSEHFGTLSWNGGNPNVVELSDVPRLAKIEKGDTIITNGRSLIFPKGIPIGNVINYELDEAEDYYVVQVRLFNDMTNIGNVYVIRNNSKEEIENLNYSDE